MHLFIMNTIIPLRLNAIVLSKRLYSIELRVFHFTHTMLLF